MNDAKLFQRQSSSKHKDRIIFAATTISDMEEWVVGIQTSIFNIWSSTNINNGQFSNKYPGRNCRGRFE